jgi:hypothetical protein
MPKDYRIATWQFLKSNGKQLRNAPAGNMFLLAGVMKNQENEAVSQWETV